VLLGRSAAFFHHSEHGNCHPADAFSHSGPEVRLQPVYRFSQLACCLRPGLFKQVRSIFLPSLTSQLAALMATPSRSSGNASEYLQPPPSPYPSTVDPSPVDSNGTTSTEVNATSGALTGQCSHLQQIEDASQENAVSEDGLTDATSPSTGIDDIASPASQQDSLGKVWDTQFHDRSSSLRILMEPQLSKLNTHLHVRNRSDSDDAPQSVIHAPADFKSFVSFMYMVAQD